MTARRTASVSVESRPSRSRRAPDWTGAACIGHDPEIWYPDPTDTIGTREAVTICQACPVRQACLDQAMREEETSGGRYGIRGGLTPMERWQLDRDQAREERRQERRKPRHPCPHCGHPDAVQHHINRCGDLLAMHAQREAGTTIPELAETYGCTIPTVRCRLNEARRRLARQAVSA